MDSTVNICVIERAKILRKPCQDKTSTGGRQGEDQRQDAAGLLASYVPRAANAEAMPALP